MKKGDFIIVLALAVLALGYGGYRLIFPASAASYVTITQNTKLLYQLPLNEDTQIRVDSPDGGYNLVVIEGGKAFIKEADCPDLVCVKSRPVSSPGETIICLPYRLVVECGGPSSSFDAVTQ